MRSNYSTDTYFKPGVRTRRLWTSSFCDKATVYIPQTVRLRIDCRPPTAEAVKCNAYTAAYCGEGDTSVKSEFGIWDGTTI